MQQDGASGHVLYFVPLRNKSEKACTLFGYPPTVSAATKSGGRSTDVHQGAYFPDPPAGDLAPGSMGLVVLDAVSNCTDTYPERPVERLRHIRIELRGGGSVGLGNIEITTCRLSVSQLGIEPTAARPAGVRACRGRDLRAGSVTSGAGMSHQATRVSLKNVSATRCWLAGYPTRATAHATSGQIVELPVGATYITAPFAGVVERAGFGEVLIETTSACDELLLPQEQHRIYRRVTIELRGGGSVALGNDVVLDATCSVLVSAVGVETTLTDSGT